MVSDRRNALSRKEEYESMPRNRPLGQDLATTLTMLASQTDHARGPAQARFLRAGAQAPARPIARHGVSAPAGLD